MVGAAKAAPYIVEEFIDRRKAKGFEPVDRIGREKSLSQRRSLGHRKNERPSLRGLAGRLYDGEFDPGSG